MTTQEKTMITVEATVDAPVEKVWELWTAPIHIIRWNNASADWQTPYATNDLHEGGRFMYRMEAKDGSVGFDFAGLYTHVETHARISYKLDDDRKVDVVFNRDGNSTQIQQRFEAEGTHSDEIQRQGWQAIMDNFKRYAEQKKLHLLQFQTTIHAPVEKVFATMLEQDTYRQWTTVFNETSHYEGSWNKGDKILFIGIDKDGKKGGMVSKIREHKPNQFISIEHLGLLEGDEEITSGEKVEGWAGSLENYTFRPVDGTTVLTVDMDANPDFKGYLEETYPQALTRLKEMCETVPQQH